MSRIVYLLHFESPLHHAKHYIGSTSHLTTRLAQHRAGMRSAARLMQAVKENGIGFTCARTWRGSRADERALKNRKNAPQLCPVCRGIKTYDQCQRKYRRWDKAV